MRIVQGRRLAAMMFTDIAGYSKLMEKDEQAIHALVEEHNELVRSALQRFGGREIRTIGDAFFIEFPSAVDAIQCAYEIQARMHEWNLNIPRERRIKVRIGLHLGDILDAGDDNFGNEVNVSARLESLAQPGGICVSQQIYDQVHGKVSFALKSEGRVELKNISQKLRIYSVVLPWQGEEKALKAAARRVLGSGMRSAQALLTSRERVAMFGLGGVVAAAFIFGLSFLVHSIGESLIPVPFKSVTESRSPAGIPEPISLRSGWMIRVDPTSSEERWEEYSPKDSWKFADRVKDEYWLRTEFVSGARYPNPAAVLGIIPDRHRVYLDGKLIGGSDYQNPVAMYAFDSGLLSPGSRHTLLVKARSHGSIAPGLMIIGRVGALVGDFSQIAPKVRLDLLAYHLPRIFSLAITSVFVLAFLIYSLLRPVNRRYLYYSMYALLGLALLLQQNPILSGNLPYKYFAFLKMFPLCLSGFILVSAYLSMQGNSRFEMRNNWAAIAWGTFLLYALGAADVDALEYQHRLNALLEISALYGAVFAVYMTMKALSNVRHGGWRVRAYSAAVFLFLLHNTFYCAISVKGEFIPGIPSVSKGPILQILLLYPVIFVVCILLVGMFDYALKQRSLQDRRSAEAIRLLADRALSSMGDTLSKVAELSRLASAFLRARRTQVLVFDGEWKVIHSLGSRSEANSWMDEARIREPVFARVGKIGHPWIISEASKDFRLKQIWAESAPEALARTETFVCVPLFSLGHPVGLVILSGREGERPYTPQDYRSVQHVMTLLSLLLALHLRSADLHSRESA